MRNYFKQNGNYTDNELYGIWYGLNNYSSIQELRCDYSKLVNDLEL